MIDNINNNKEKMIRIIVADDHKLFRSGLISLLEDEKDFFIVGEADNGEELLQLYFDLKPDVIVVDISMPFLNGVEALAELKKKDKNVKALFVSMHDTEEYIYYAMKNGAYGLISKNIMKGELTYAIRAANDGKQYFGQNWPEEKLKELYNRFEFLSGKKNDNKPNLSPREREILKNIGEGLTSSEIATRVHLSKRTVDAHRAHIMRKLEVTTLPELMKYAIKYLQMGKNNSQE
ncbi:MAG: response regulator transcription factor [Bacteroidetes bacterium]|nr:response regulator transcription factor [Bacteroidota bacterium]